MQNALTVRVLNGVGDLRGEFRGAPWFEGSVPCQVREVWAGNQIHREIMLASLFANVVDGDNVRMLEVARRRGFGPKPFHVFGFREQTVAQEFYGDEPIQSLLPRAKNNSHCAARDFLQQFVTSEAADCGLGNKFKRIRGVR